MLRRKKPLNDFDWSAIFERAGSPGERTFGEERDLKGMASADIEDQTSAAAGRRDAVLPTVFMLLPLPATGKGVSYGCASIARNLAKMAFVIELFTPYGNETSSGRYRMTQTLPFPLPQLPFRKVRNLVYRVLRSFAVARNEAAMRKAALRERATAHRLCLAGALRARRFRPCAAPESRSCAR